MEADRSGETTAFETVDIGRADDPVGQGHGPVPLPFPGEVLEVSHAEPLAYQLELRRPGGAPLDRRVQDVEGPR